MMLNTVAAVAELAQLALYIALLVTFWLYRRNVLTVTGGSLWIVAAIEAFLLPQVVLHAMLALALIDGSATLTGAGVPLFVAPLFTLLPFTLALPRVLRRMQRLSAEARKTAEAQAEVRMRDQFMSIAAHELKTPVTSIAGFGQLLLRLDERGRLTPEMLRSRLEAQAGSIKRLVRLIDELLDYSRVTQGHLQLLRAPVDVYALLSDAARDTGYRRGEGRIHIEGQPLTTCADGVRLYQVFVNLLDNATKFSKKNVDVRLKGEGDALCVHVRDYGPGMTSEEIAHLFKPFERARENYPEGLGLGLSISRTIVELHDGQLTFENHPGEGVEFTVSLPLTSCAPEAAVAA